MFCIFNQSIVFSKEYETRINQYDSIKDVIPKLYYKAILDQVCIDMPSQCIALLKNPDSIQVKINAPVSFSATSNEPSIIAKADISIYAVKVDLSLVKSQTYPKDFRSTIENTLLKIGSYKFQKRYISNL